MNTILVAVDFSPASKTVVHAAANLARQSNAKLVLLTVLVEPVFVKEYAPAAKDVEKLSVTHQRAIKNHLGKLRDNLGSASLPVEIITRRGDAARGIVDEANARRAALIVIGAHGHSKLFELVLGSTTQRVLKHARCPVVVIPLGMQKRAR